MPSTPRMVIFDHQERSDIAARGRQAAARRRRPAWRVSENGDRSSASNRSSFYDKGGRAELAAQEREEIAIIFRLISPKQMSEDDVKRGDIGRDRRDPAPPA